MKMYVQRKRFFALFAGGKTRNNSFIEHFTKDVLAAQTTSVGSENRQSLACRLCPNIKVNCVMALSLPPCVYGVVFV